MKTTQLRILFTALLLSIPTSSLPEKEDPAKNLLLLEKKLPPKSGKKELMYAARKGDLEKVKLLISNGVDINQQHEFGITALMEAEHNGHLEIVKLLVNNKANLDLEGSHFEIGGSIVTALTCAVKNGHFEIVEFLVNSGANVNGGLGGALYCAVFSDNLKIAQFLVNNGANVNDIVDHSATTLLMQTAYNKSDSFDIIRLLVNNGAKINLQNKYGHTALMLAIASNKFKAAKFLVDRGADITKKENKNRTTFDLLLEKAKKLYLKQSAHSKLP